jgi:acylphosphatase
MMTRQVLLKSSSGHEMTISKLTGEVQGEDDNVKKLLKDINNGPRRAHVVKVEKAELDVKEGEVSFEVR